jgi:hypothetical protein
VGKLFRVTVVVVVVLAVTAILLTPSPTDDVLGVLHKAQVYGLQISSAATGVFAVSSTRTVPQPVQLFQPDSSALLDLVCVRLC